MIQLDPTLGPSGLANPTTSLTLKTGRELYLCNDYEALRDAIAAEAPFEAHQVVAMTPRPIVINPAHVAVLEKAST